MAALRHVAQSIAISRSPADRALAISSAKKFARWIVTPASAPAAVAQLARSPNGERDASPSEEIVRRSSARVPVLSFAEGGSMASHSADQRHPSIACFYAATLSTTPTLWRLVLSPSGNPTELAILLRNILTFPRNSRASSPSGRRTFCQRFAVRSAVRPK